MTAPPPGAIRLPRNKFLTPILEGLDGYTDALDDVEAIDDYLRSLTPIPPVPAGVALGPVDEWQLAEDDRDAAVEKLERHRNRALARRRGAIATSASVLRGAVDDVLQQLHLRLVDVLLKAGPDAEVLIAAGVDSASAAIERDLVAEWQRLQQETWPDYRLLRDSQEAVVFQLAPQRIWMSAKPSLDGEDPASLLWFKNLGELWPDWRQRGRTRPQTTLMGPPPRPEPWPKPDGAEFLIWSFKAGAHHWIPTVKEFDTEFNQAHHNTDTSDLAARRAEFDALNDNPEHEPYASLLIGRPNAFRGLPPPMLADQLETVSPPTEFEDIMAETEGGPAK